MRTWTLRRWGMAAVTAAVVALAIGLPTEIIPNPVFGRMMPTEWWNYPTWIATSVLAGLVAATYVRRWRVDGAEAPARRAGVGGLLTFFAVGCPVCNKLVVLALGTSGAMSWFAPLQPALAVAGIVLLGFALRTRLRGERSCAVEEQRLATR